MDRTIRLKDLWDEWRYLRGRRSVKRLTTAIWNTYFDTWIASGDWHLGSDGIWCKHLRWAWEKPSITSCDQYDPLAKPLDHQDPRRADR